MAAAGFAALLGEGAAGEGNARGPAGSSASAVLVESSGCGSGSLGCKMSMDLTP